MKQKNLKWDRGISLIALAVTITVTLILVGVTIRTLNGENGVINQARKMSETEQQKQENSQIQIKELEIKLATSEDELTISESELSTLINQIVDIKLKEDKLNTYPVGSIYTSINNTSPAELFGGTWERIEDTFLLAAGSKYAAGTTGGEETHTLTVDEMPAHSHYTESIVGQGEGTKNGYLWGLNIADWGTQPTQIAGGSQPHNNMPPYLTVYVWKRVS